MSKVGFSRESRTTSLKEFTPNSQIYNGLCLGIITNISLGEADYTKSKSPFWTGHKVPRLAIQIESCLDPDGVKKSYYQEAFVPPAWTPDLLPDAKLHFKLGAEESKLGHILEAIKGSFTDPSCWSDEVMAKLTTGLELTGEDKQFIVRTPEDVAKAYTTFYQNIVDAIEAGGKPAYRDANGKPKEYWLKLLYTVKDSPVNQGKLGFPNYADTGFIEEVSRDTGGQLRAPAIKIQVNKQESIHPESVKVKDKPKPNMPGMQGAPTDTSTAPAGGGGDKPSWM